MNKKTTIAVVVSVALVIFIAISNGLVSGLFSGSNTNQNQDMSQSQSQIPGQLQIQDVKVGDGAVATAGKSVTVNYTGVFTDGKKFDSSRDPGRAPFTFTLGAGQVIKGWDTGVEGMKVGGTRIIVVPPELGYGSQAYGPIPANSTLVFEVELLGVK